MTVWGPILATTGGRRSRVEELKHGMRGIEAFGLEECFSGLKFETWDSRIGLRWLEVFIRRRLVPRLVSNERDWRVRLLQEEESRQESHPSSRHCWTSRLLGTRRSYLLLVIFAV